MKSSASRRMMVVGSLLLVGAVAGLHHREQPVDAVAADASKAAAGQGHVAPVDASQESTASSPERRADAPVSSAVGRSFAPSSAASQRARSAVGASSSVEEEVLDAAPLTRTKVRDRSVGLAVRASGQKHEHEHGSRVEAAGMPSTMGVAALATNQPPQEVQQGEASEEVAAETVRPAELPLVYRLSDEQLLEHSPSVSPEVLEPIRDQFDRDAGVGELDPADPEYTRRWNVAGPTADERYRTLFGWAAYNDMSRRAAQAGQQ